MANIKSAEKRIKINKRNRLQNKFYKSSIRTLIKVFLKDLTLYKKSGKLENKAIAQTRLNSIYSLIDKATKKKVLHKNTAARKKSNLAFKLKNI